jgi:4-alpha-glucanotransferase
VDWLKEAGQRAWQILPLSIPDGTGSPYASTSKTAGNWMLVSGEVLQQQGLLPDEWRRLPTTARVHYPQVRRDAWRMIRTSYTHFQLHARPMQRTSFEQFQRRHHAWLDEYVLFQALKDRHRQRQWWTWDSKWRTPKDAYRHIDASLRRQMKLHAYAQWVWYEQWDALHRYARRQGISIIGDVPFFISADSVDVWSKRHLFLLRSDGQPSVVAGVPPDDFARDGQRWGSPLYDWPAHRKQQWKWWIDRFRSVHSKVDRVRFDHFRGLIRTWHIPIKSKNGRVGVWVPSPGRELLRAVKRHVPHLDLIVEDLGPDTIGGDALRKDFHAPTIRLWLFGWSGTTDNPHVVSSLASDVVVYTSNHDTNTVMGWWKTEAKWYERKHVREQLQPGRTIAQAAIEQCLASSAGLSIIAVPDLLDLGTAARFNRPGRQRGNWNWRLRSGQLTPKLARRLRQITQRYGRV